jgi:hypothetical protein
VQQAAEQLAQHDEGEGHRRRRDQHLSGHALGGRGVQRRGDLQEGDERDLGSDADKQHQERVDHTGSGD